LFVFEAGLSEAGTAGGRLGTLGGLCMVPPLWSVWKNS